MPRNGNVAIIILNYNNPVATIRCLNSLKLLLEGEAAFDTIVVDNGSTDNSISQIHLNYPELNIIESKVNLGFAGGNNLGIKYALEQNYPYILLLNNDTQIIDGNMLDELIASGADIAGPLLKYQKDNVSMIDYGGIFDRFKGRNTHHEYRELEVPKILPTPDYLSGTCLMIKGSVFKTIGLLDDKFFLYYEDVDFCLRAKKAGLVMSLCPNIRLYHQLSASSNKLGKKKLKILAASHMRFTLKHISPIFWPLAFIYNLYLLVQ